jgi:hypothetical protein
MGRDVPEASKPIKTQQSMRSRWSPPEIGDWRLVGLKQIWTLVIALARDWLARAWLCVIIRAQQCCRRGNLWRVSVRQSRHRRWRASKECVWRQHGSARQCCSNRIACRLCLVDRQQEMRWIIFIVRDKFILSYI